MKLFLILIIICFLSGCGVASMIKCGTAPESVCNRIELFGFEL